MRSDPTKDFRSFALRMLGSMSQHLRVIVGLLDDLTLKDMETRLANWLLKQCPRPVSATQVEIKLDRTKRVLAAEFGATSETLSRTLAKFRDQKLLRVTGNTLVVTDLPNCRNCSESTWEKSSGLVGGCVAQEMHTIPQELRSAFLFAA